MKNGFGLELGPFELMDKLGKSWIENRLLSENKTVPTILNKLSDEKFYKVEEGKLQYYDFNKNFYKDFDRPEGVLILSDIKKSKKPIEKISTASLWDIDDGVTVFEIHSRGNKQLLVSIFFDSQKVKEVNFHPAYPWVHLYLRLPKMFAQSRGFAPFHHLLYLVLFYWASV